MANQRMVADLWFSAPTNWFSLRTGKPTRLGAVIATLFASVAVTRAAQISMPGASATPGSSIAIPLNLDSQSSLVSGLQLDLEYVSGVSVTATIGELARSSGKSFYQADIQP